MSRRGRVVDDDEATRAVLGRLLGAEGWTVEVCEDGARALEMLAEGGFDVLLTDLVMPAMSGRELVVAAKATSPGLRCVIMSGFAAPEGESSGAAWLMKPIDFDELMALVTVETTTG